MRCATALVLALTVGVTAVPVAALTPLPPCEGVESNMITGHILPLGEYDAETGVVVERYGNAQEIRDNVYVSRPAPVPQLADFYGVRVTFCATGEFLAIDGREPEEVNAALSATEFLRGKLQAGQPIRFGDLRRAADAVYGAPIVLRETEETCGCSVFFPGHRPADMRPFGERTDIEYQ